MPHLTLNNESSSRGSRKLARGDTRSSSCPRHSQKSPCRRPHAPSRGKPPPDTDVAALLAWDENAGRANFIKLNVKVKNLTPFTAVLGFDVIVDFLAVDLGDLILGHKLCE